MQVAVQLIYYDLQTAVLHLSNGRTPPEFYFLEYLY